MSIKRHQPEAIVSKLRQFEVPVGHTCPSTYHVHGIHILDCALQLAADLLVGIAGGGRHGAGRGGPFPMRFVARCVAARFG